MKTRAEEIKDELTGEICPACGQITHPVNKGPFNRWYCNNKQCYNCDPKIKPMETIERHKPINLFLKDGKLMAAFLPEKHDHLCGTDIFPNVCHVCRDYERAKSEALSQAMDVANPGDFGFYLSSQYETWFFNGNEMNKGEFYPWNGHYEITKVLACAPDHDHTKECYYTTSVKLLPGNVKEPETNEETQDNAELVKMKIRKALIRAAIDLGPASHEVLADMIEKEILTEFTITRKK